jgi:DNA-binding PadR family transcriptional regulator
MSVRSGILAVLSLGPAYGSQVHGEIEARTERHGQINVGQIYSTLERLQTRGLVRAEGLTDDGLPLYALTPTGHIEVEAWLREPESAASWADFVSHILMAASLPHAPVSSLIASYRRVLGAHHAGVDAPRSLAALASARFEEAALDWLDAVEAALEQPDMLARPLGDIRPRRGRRPRQSIG